MALKSLTLQNFRSISQAQFPLHPQNLLRGKNGTGKSSIKEALCFVFTGTDSTGSRNPQHLISFGQPFTEGVVVTDRATLSRKLTDKGVVTLKLTVNEVTTPITQAQLELSVGSPDVFLSAFLPGFFLALNPERRHKVLSELLPPVDRKALLEELAGVPVMPDEALAFGLSRRVDLIVSTIALRRRQAEKDVAGLQGQVQGLRSLTPVERPATPGDASTIVGCQTLLKREWDEARMREARRLQAEESALQATLKPAPSAPALSQEISTDNCPSCGQIVGSKHREKVQALNFKAQEEFQRVVDEVYAFNAKTGTELQALRKKRYELDTAATFPGAPAEVYDPFKLHEAEQQMKSYMDQLTRYNLYQEQSAQAETRVAELQQKIDTISRAAERYAILEKAVMQLPSAELKLQGQALQMENVVLDTQNSLDAHWKGVAYPALSSGQRMRCGVELCRKFNSLMKKPIGAIFVDDAELMDGNDAFAEDLQWFVCKVDPSQETLSILAPAKRTAMLYE